LPDCDFDQVDIDASGVENYPGERLDWTIQKTSQKRSRR
jgi:hypothetical protein